MRTRHFSEGAARVLAAGAMAALAATGCDGEAGDRGMGPMAAADGGAGGKADDTELQPYGPATIRIELGADPHALGNVETARFELYWGFEATEENRVELHDEFFTELTGMDCVTVVSHSNADAGDGVPSTFTTQSCDLGLLADPEAPTVLSLPVVTMSHPEIDVDFGITPSMLGLGGPQVYTEAWGGYQGIPVGETVVLAPGTYSVKFGHDERLGYETVPYSWQVADVTFDQFGDYRTGFELTHDLRTQVFIEAPTEEAYGQPASAQSKCRPQIEVWTSAQTANGAFSRPLGEDHTLHFMPYAGADYELRIAGLTVRDEWEGEDGTGVYSLHVPTYRYEVPGGASDESGTYTIERLSDGGGMVSCKGVDFPTAKRNSTFTVGTYVDLPAGTYVEEVTYDGTEPVRHEFTLGE